MRYATGSGLLLAALAVAAAVPPLPRQDLLAGGIGPSDRRAATADRPAHTTGPWRPGAASPPQDELVAGLGCGACHQRLPAPARARAAAPPLDFAGLRYRPGYLFRYLRDPHTVRPHIGPARMPSFHLDEREALALVLFLAGRRDAPPGSGPGACAVVPDAGADRDGEALVGEMGCRTCHAVGGQGGRLAPDLARSGGRLRRRWLRHWLAAPRSYLPETPMPASFFREGPEGLEPVIADAADRLAAVATFIEGLDDGSADRDSADLAAAVERHPDVAAEQGARIYRALGCAGCHGRDAATPAVAAPVVADAGGRLRGGWLRDYLRRPYARRPSGHDPGTGARMPDFRLTEAEVDRVADALGPAAPEGDAPVPLPGPARARAERLLRRSLPCMGCHQLDGDGGRIGPDLTDVAARLPAASIRAMIADPAATAPGTVMPRTPMKPERAELVARYLAQRSGVALETEEAGATDRAGPRRGYLSLIDHAPREAGSEAGAAALYARHCAMCHGQRGEGDGWNAGFLPVRPTRHADSAAMSARPDATLFDGIHVGGFVLDRDHRMPGFGEALSEAQIRSLVSYIRELCRCLEPGWARDGGGP